MPQTNRWLYLYYGTTAVTSIMAALIAAFGASPARIGLLVFLGSLTILELVLIILLGLQDTALAAAARLGRAFAENGKGR